MYIYCYIETSNISSTNQPPGSDDMIINYVHLEYLYAYAFSGGYSLSLTISLLCLHVLIVLGQRSSILHSSSMVQLTLGEHWRAARYGAPVETSPESRMENVGGGVATARTWGLR
uniref:Uncharacterized protein n=1 Tax=Bionectria ochroleuca TaxID=29856 RepID=A0A8H7KEB5_BIOOC